MSIFILIYKSFLIVYRYNYCLRANNFFEYRKYKNKKHKIFNIWIVIS